MKRLNSFEASRKQFIVLIIGTVILGVVPTVRAMDVQWAGMKGVLDYGVSSVYGTQGVTNPSNHPGGRYLSASWKDTSGTL